MDDIRAIVREAVRDELHSFNEAEIQPLRRAIEELQRRDELAPKDDFELSPPVRPPKSPSTPSLLQRVGTKVVSSFHDRASSMGSSIVYSTPSSVVSSREASREHSREASPISSPLQGPMSSPMSICGPVTVRRNSGVTRATEVRDVSLTDLTIPRSLEEGVEFLRITHKKKVLRLVTINRDAGIVAWNTKTSSQLSIDRICEIYVGEEAKNYREEFRISAEHSQHWATIIHQRAGETKLRALHLINANQNEFNLFISCLFKLVKYRREIMSGLALAGPRFVDLHWNQHSEVQAAEQQQGKRLSFAQVLRLSRQLHVHCSKAFIRQVFNDADKDHSRHLDFEEFREFVRLLKQRADIANVYEAYQIGANTSNFLSFFDDVQHQPLPSSVILPLRAPPTLEEFTQMLLPLTVQSDDGLNGSSTELNYPLSNYFISSSHNSYLMGRQIVDGSSIESCIRALQDGCRCIELDCWDGPKGQSPVVYHGHSIARLTTSVVFSDVIEAVQKYAFISTPYPLILSLEIRCNESSQLRIVSILRTILANVLVTEPVSPTSDELPSPEMLKHRILIKVKGIDGDDFSSGDESEMLDASKRLGITQQLADFGVYLSGKRFTAFGTNESTNRVYSLNERTIRAMAKDPKKAAAIKNYTRKNVMRVYPAPYRLSSSNFDPIYFWKLGVQMAALNWQTFDLGMQLNTAFFANRIGYVLKPQHMRSSSLVEDCSLNVRERGREKFGPVTCLNRAATLEITIVSAQQLPRPKFLKDADPFSPYVILEVFGLGSLDANISPQWRTDAFFDNGFNPIWNYPCSVQLTPEDYEFACVRLSVAVEGQTFAYHVCRVAAMQRGYRHVPLIDTHGEDFIFSSLFIKTTLREN